LKKCDAVKQKQLDEEKIYKMLLEFDTIYDKLSQEDKRKVLHALIAEIQVFPKDEIAETKTYIKKIRYAFDVEHTDFSGDELGNKGNNAETVCLLSRKTR